MAPGSTFLRGQQRNNGLAFARAWREHNKPIFDDMDRRGMFADSPAPREVEQ